MRTISARRKGRVNCVCVWQENLLPAPRSLLPSWCPHPLRPSGSPLGSPSPRCVLTPYPPLHVVERGDGCTCEGHVSSGLRPGSVLQLLPPEPRAEDTDRPVAGVRRASAPEQQAEDPGARDNH